ncbi:complement factor I isoform X2 [Excalfactoria chinensis]|uniref:complement factor I isoform X2 n=1 Tax=Excalfactoria chinensis TaxID=46218 RepID=UPI003B3AD794
MRVVAVFLVSFSLFSFCRAQNAASNDTEEHFSYIEPAQPVEPDSQPAEQDTYLIEECLSNKYTHKSCKKVFCHPWERCVEGKCLCKLPYQCPRNGTSVCSTTGRHFHTYCHLKSYECQRPEAKFLNKGKCTSTECSAGEFHCANDKCISVTKACDGINDCGDLSDELCCKECRNNSFHCRSNICIPNKDVCNKEVDCLTGEDEAQALCSGKSKLMKIMKKNDENHSMDAERKLAKTFLPQINCGVVNHTLTRRKRIIGGQTARKGEFPWQVAIKDSGTEGTTVYCGGVYIGGCWVLTAAHCVSATRVHLYRVWIGLLDTIQYDTETDTYRLNQLIIHEKYNAATYENDIALLELKGHGKGECSLKYSIPACIPWSEHMFKAGDKCKVSGWGLEKGYTKQYVLKWGNVNLFQNCSELYPGRFLQKMACAGTYDGSIDSCKGDSGGPLVCFDAENVAYVWGVVSWGENCGEAGHPGVYTQVASYYDWISHHVTRSLISRYNI